MRPTQPLTITLVLLWLVPTIPLAFAKSIEEQKWIRMESENFSIYSTVNKIDSKNLIKHLEAVRSLLPAVSQGDMASQIPTQIFVVSTGSQFEQLGFDPNEMSGVFVPGLRRNFIVMVDTHGYDGTPIIVHEYVHYLVRNAIRLSFPRWFEEGYADYIASSLLTKKDFSFGRADYGHLQTLASKNWLDMEKVVDSHYLLSNDEPDADLKFYAQSWLLVHYLVSEAGGFNSIMQNFARFMEARRQGANELEAFEAAFGLQVADLEQLLKRYAKKGKYMFSRVPVDRTIDEIDPEVTVLDRAEISIELAELLLMLGRGEPDAANSDKASPRELFSIALDDEEARARAEMGLAMLAETAGNEKTAEERATLAAEQAPGDLSVQLDAANLWIERANRAPALSAQLVSRSEPYLRNALAIDDSNAEVTYSVGMYLLLNGEIDKGLQHLETAAYKAPSVLQLQWVLTQAMVRHGLRDKALHYARELLYTRHVSKSLAQRLRELIDELETQPNG